MHPNGSSLPAVAIVLNIRTVAITFISHHIKMKCVGNNISVTQETKIPPGGYGH
jgi:hypothetical protein